MSDWQAGYDAGYKAGLEVTFSAPPLPVPPPDTPSGIQAAVAAKLRRYAEQQTDPKLAAAFLDAADKVDRSEM